MPQVFAVMNEGHVPINKQRDGIIVCTSMWLTRSEAEYAINRTFNNFGSWTPKRRWIEKVTIGKNEMHKVSNLNNGRPEYCLSNR